MIDKNTLLDLLRTNIVAVKFIKKDGSVRHMICTLNPSHMPERNSEQASEQKQRKTQPADIVAVYDLEKDDWRSFNINSVTRIQIDSVDMTLITEEDDEETNDIA
jgi:hypothetical protein